VIARAEARVIAFFTFIVALLPGAWGGLDRLSVGPPARVFSEPEPGRFVIALLPFAPTAVAFEAANSVTAACARALGGAAVLLGVLTCLGGVLYFVASW
jgi:hypothetical protein